MTYRGIVHGRRIELQQLTPYRDGEAVTVQIQPSERGTRASIIGLLAELRTLPSITQEDVDALGQAIEEGRLPPPNPINFD